MNGWLRMNRADLQNLAKLRAKEAKVLLDQGCYEGAYYLVGYAVECALKACIAKQTQRYDFPDKQKVKVQDCYHHDLDRLLRIAGLSQKLDADRQADSVLDVNWSVTKDWKEDKRYLPAIPEKQARDLVDAVTMRGNGVLAWLKKLW